MQIAVSQEMEIFVSGMLTAVGCCRDLTGAQRLPSLQWYVNNGRFYVQRILTSVSYCANLAFRVYSHHMALNHATYLSDLLSRDAVAPITSDTWTAAYDGWDRKSLIDDTILDKLTMQIEHGGNEFRSHVDRARKQYSKKVAQGK